VVNGGKARIILGALATPGEVPEERPALALLWLARFRWRLWPRQATGDKAYGTLEIVRALEEQGVTADVLLPERAHAAPFFSTDAFRYDPRADAYTCPGGATLPYICPSRPQPLFCYQADPATCQACALKARCTASAHGRMISRHYDEDFLDRVRAYHDTKAYHKARRKHSMWVDPLFAEAKDWHGMRRCRLRRLWRVNVQVLWTAGGQNLKRLPARRGWGRRPFPAAPGLHLDVVPALLAAC